ncbi:MAG TPA: PEP/pyruvate-binding domain-containing protein [Thermoanaerobaculia bacterium]|nr:PEP/pyruvate-binding domain-containing protein [Thermoanaerobaculia bacterium]
MGLQIREILLVASPYDAFILEADGQLSELVLSETLDATPAITSVASGREALRLLAGGRRFDLVVATLHVGDVNAVEIGRALLEKDPQAPLVILASDARELAEFLARHGAAGVWQTFVWQGDVRLLSAIVRCVEDRKNVAHDAIEKGVQVILLVEDSVRYASSFLPAIYDELLEQSHRLLPEGINVAHKLARLRARPKILLCRTFEEAWDDFLAYETEILGVISDVEFPRARAWSATAGIELAKDVRKAAPDVPIVLQSSRPENDALARAAGAAFLLKGSPTLLHELRRLMTEYFGFGDFVFRLPDGTEVDRASDLKALEEKLRTVPVASIAYHGERNHFSKWLKARTEFAVAQKLRPRKVSDFASYEDLRKSLIASIAEYRSEQSRATVADFDRLAFDGTASFSRIGGGSLGGKARGLAFVRTLVSRHGLSDRFPGVTIGVPPAVVLGTQVFDRFLDESGLRDFAIHETDDAEVIRRFLEAEFPEDACQDLAAFLARVHWPLAVRSSSILEDSQYQPFTGVYDTHMLANDAAGIETRLADLLRAIKRVYASTFFRRAKGYLSATPYRLEEEKMAVLVQRIVGARRGRGARFYPDFAGVARSHNFYPAPPLAAADGIAAVALGLGRTVVEGGNCARFSPKAPQRLAPYASATELLDGSQREFWALDLAGAGDAEMREARYGLEVAEADGVLARLASTYSPENDALTDGIGRAGIRVVTFAPILKQEVFPLARVLQALLAAGEEGMSAPVEIEFAVNLDAPRGPELGILQMRPLALSREGDELALDDVGDETVLCRSRNVLGNGRIDVIRDLVVVDAARFERARSREAAEAIARLNARLSEDGRPYLLVGVGRWGSKDPWLGIPVTWEQISGARAIVETGLRDIAVSPSQGSHFFQNLMTFNVGYFTVGRPGADGFVDWAWLASQPADDEAGAVRHLRLSAPAVVTMNGRKNEGMILKPPAT